MSARPSPPAAPTARTDEMIEEALASARLEGLEPSAEVIEDARQAVAGALHPDELIARTLARHKQ